MIRWFCIQSITFYQRYLSALLGDKCRYYPSCSEYSKQAFYFQNPCIALISTLLRILKCNQLFKGGIDYPKVNYQVSLRLSQPCPIVYWLIPLCYIPKGYPNLIWRNYAYPLQPFYIIKNFSKVSCA